MRKKILIAAGVLVVLVIIVIIIRRQTSTATAYVTAAVTKGDITQTVSASGNVNPATVYNVSPRFSAKVVAVNVAAGNTVTAGEQLAKLDDTDLQSAVKTAEYNFNSAVYTRNQAKKVPPPAFDQNNVDKAQQAVNAASVQLQTAKNNLNNASIISPIAGKVLNVNLKVGDYASLSALQPAFVIGDGNPLEAILNVNEIDIDKVKVGQDASSTVDAVNNTLPGKVLTIAPSGTIITGIVYYQVQTSITDQTGLLPNMSVNTDITVDSKQNVLLIPSAAIQVINDKSYVHIPVKDTSGKVTSQEKEVQIGLNNNTNAEVLSGLSLGDQVIMNYNNTTTQASSTGFNFGGTSSGN